MNDQIRGVVVGFDGSRGAQIALDWAAETARRQHKALTVLHCGAPPPALSPPYPVTIRPSLDDEPRGVLETGIERASKVLGPADVVGLNAAGSPAAELVRASEQADLIVTGSRGRGRLLGGLLGSTSYAVTAHAHCPAVVVRTEPSKEPTTPEPPGPEHHVVVGVDGSAASTRAVHAAAELAASTGAPLHLVCVAQAASMEAVMYTETAKAGDEHTHAMRQEAERTLEHAAEPVRIARPDVRVETEVLFGEPGHALADLGARAGLVVVGSRGRGGFAGLLLGSVSHTVIHEAACPVMVVH